MSSFTSRTIVEVIPPLFELLTHRQIDRVLLKLGLQNVASLKNLLLLVSISRKKIERLNWRDI